MSKTQRFVAGMNRGCALLMTACVTSSLLDSEMAWLFPFSLIALLITAHVGWDTVESKKDQDMVDEKLAERVVAFLNELVKVDRKAIERLIDARVECNEEMTKHETVKVAGPPLFPTWVVGFLGVINGLCGIDEDGRGHVEAVYDYGELVGRQLIGFRCGGAKKTQTQWENSR